MLIRGIDWATSGPVLQYQDDGGAGLLPLAAGDWLRFSVRPGPRLCLGSFAVHGPVTATHMPCPRSAAAERGYQCGGCFSRDDFRYMHDIHHDTPRSGAVPAGLRAYLSQEHWLYIATFAGGATKVGTASGTRKWGRLAEQGAVVARYVAQAQDGRIVRLLEDRVTENLGLSQQVRSAAKAEALTEPRPAAELAAVNAAHGAKVRQLLEVVALDGFRIIEEDWVRPALASLLCQPGSRHGYPHGLEAGQHGLELKSMLGGYALAGVDGSDLDFVVNLGGLKGRCITLGQFSSAPASVQEPLF